MKFKKPDSIMPTLVFVGSAIAGAMVGRVVYDQLPTPGDTTKETIYRGGLALVGAGGSAFVDGKDNIAMAARGAMLGIALDQGLSVIKTQAKNLNVENRMMKSALGLGCACQENNNKYDEFVSLGQGRVIPLIEERSSFQDLGSSENPISVLGI